MNFLIRGVCVVLAICFLLFTGCRNSSQFSKHHPQEYDFDQASESGATKMNEDLEALRSRLPGARGFPQRFELLNGHDVGRVLDGKTFEVNLPGVHPLLGENVPVRVRGLHALELPPARTEDLPSAITQWDQLRKLIENARRIELRRLERGKDKFYLLADVYLDGEFLSQNLCGGPPLPSD